MALIDIPSESQSETRLADLVQEALDPLDHLVVDRIGDTVVARTQWGRDERVLLGGHLDTVPEAGNGRAIRVAAGASVPVVGLDGIAVSPEDRIYGLGACDMKGGVAVALKCAQGLRDAARDITYVFYAGEEIADEYNGLGQVAGRRPELLSDIDLAVLMEPSGAGVEAGCQGTLRVAVTVHGRRAHSARSWLGENAIHGAHEVLDRLAGYQPRTVVIDGLEYREGLNAVLVSGGSATNVIPDECRVTVNYRYAPDVSPQEALTHVREEFGGFEITVLDNVGGALPGLSHPVSREFLAATGAVPQPKFGWTDVSRFAALGVPALNFGPGSPTLAHTREEFVPVADLLAVLDALQRWLAPE
jgi:succinyl-diaminopimelate desuccinylase